MALEKAAGRIGRGDFDRRKVSRQIANLSRLLEGTEQEILILVIESGERANNVPRVSSDAEFSNPADVDGDFHLMRFYRVLESWNMRCADEEFP